MRLIGREQEAGRAALLGAVPALLAVATVLTGSGAARTGLVLATVVTGVAWCLVWWPELLVMAYMFTGRFAFDPRLAPGGLNVSFNQVMFVGVLFIIVVHARRVMTTGRSLAGMGLIGFSVVLAAGMLWTLGPTYGASKVVRTLGVVLPSALATIGLLRARRSVVPLFAAIWAVGFGLNLAAWARYPASLDEARRLTALGSGPNVFGRTVGLTVLVSVFLVIWLAKKRGRTRLENVLLVGAVASAVATTPGFVLAQARGPSLAMVAALGMFALLSLGGSWRRVAAIALLAAGAWLLVDYTMSNLVLASRFDLSNEWNMGSIVYRQAVLLETADLVGRNPWLGVGTGGWPVEIFGIDDRRYPHHFFAEVAAELGLPVATALLALFIALPISALRVWRRLDDGPARSALLASATLFVYFAVNIQISGDSVDNRLIWILLAALEAATLYGAAACSPATVAAPPGRRLAASIAPATLPG